jgi:hypothetical protein
MTIFGQDRISMALQKRRPAINRELLYDSLAGFLLGTFIVCCGALLVYLIDGIEWTDVRFIPGDIFLGLVIMLLVAAAEEFIFRGLILRKLLHLINKWLALLISAALFAAVHMANTDITPLGIFNVFLGGLVFGVGYMLTRSLPLVILFHFAWNFFQGPILGFPVSGLPFESVLLLEVSKHSIINGGSFGFEGSLICSVLLVLTFIAAYLLYQQKHRKPPAAVE